MLLSCTTTCACSAGTATRTWRFHRCEACLWVVLTISTVFIFMAQHQNRRVHDKWTMADVRFSHTRQRGHEEARRGAAIFLHLPFPSTSDAELVSVVKCAYLNPCLPRGTESNSGSSLLPSLGTCSSGPFNTSTISLTLIQTRPSPEPQA